MKPKKEEPDDRSQSPATTSSFDSLDEMIPKSQREISNHISKLKKNRDTKWWPLISVQCHLMLQEKINVLSGLLDVLNNNHSDTPGVGSSFGTVEALLKHICTNLDNNPTVKETKLAISYRQLGNYSPARFYGTKTETCCLVEQALKELQSSPSSDEANEETIGNNGSKSLRPLRSLSF